MLTSSRGISRQRRDDATKVRVGRVGIVGGVGGVGKTQITSRVFPHATYATYDTYATLRLCLCVETAIYLACAALSVPACAQCSAIVK